jgi:predicted enzyme related to lactoylglutathione lyase
MRYAHTNIAAKDHKVLAQFYMDVFDCKIKPPERNLSGDWLDRATGLTSARLKGVHLAFEVEDVEKILKKALTKGGSPLGQVTRREVEGVGLLTFVYFRDPEGNIIEIQSWG